MDNMNFPRRWSLVSVALVVVPLAAARPVALTSPTSSFQAAQGSQAPVVVDPPVVDFGKVAPGSKHPAKFAIRNLGQSPVTIKSVVPSCKCTDINVLAGTVIAPGGSVELLATLDVPRTPGEKDAKVFLTFEGYDAPRMAMLKADASLPIRVVPAYVDSLKKVTTGTIQVTSEDGKPFTILSAGGLPPKFSGFDSSKDAPRAQYTLRWEMPETPDTPCEPMPLWWVIETDRADCPLVALRIRDECTGSLADPTRVERFWFFPEPIGVAGRLSEGESIVLPIVIEHYNPKGKGAIVRPEWSQVRGVRSLSPKITATLEGTRPGNKDDVAVLIRLAPAAGVSGVIYAPVEIETATGRGVFAVSMQALSKSTSTAP